MKPGRFIFFNHWKGPRKIIANTSFRFVGRKNTIVVLLYRPSPQIPEPSADAARKCYDACVFNVAMHREQMATGSVDLTWASTQALFMAISTLLWTLSYPEIRQEHSIDEVKGYLHIALEGVMISAQRWPGCESALHLYQSLISACLKSYGTTESFVVHSPSTHPSPVSTHDTATPPTMSSPSANSQHSVQTVTPASQLVSDADIKISLSREHTPTYSPVQNMAVPTSQSPLKQSNIPPTTSSPLAQPPPVQSAPLNHPLYDTRQPYAPPMTANYCDPNFDAGTPFNSFPSVVPGLPGWDPNYTAASTRESSLSYVGANVDPMFWMGTFGDQYSQYSNQPGPWRGRTLSQEEQVELMDSLADNIPDVSSLLVNHGTVSYHS